MSNLLVEIGNTALKAAWSDRMTLGKTFRYQGEKHMDFILSLTRREKPAVMVVSSVYPVSEQDVAPLRESCGNLLILDSNNRERLIGKGLPPYISYDPAAATGPALVIVGVMMLTNTTSVDWGDYTEAIPAFITMLLMPLSYGIMLGLIMYVLMKVALGMKGIRQISPTVWTLFVVFVLRYIQNSL